MTFDEIPLYLAVHDLRQSDHDLAADPVTERQRERIIERLTLEIVRTEKQCRYSADDMLIAWTRFRKGLRAHELIVGVVMLNGQTQCFYKNRQLGDCVPEVHFDHIVPRSLGGPDEPWNGVLACRFHNCQRGNQEIGAYLMSGRCSEESNEEAA